MQEFRIIFIRQQLLASSSNSISLDDHLPHFIRNSHFHPVILLPFSLLSGHCYSLCSFLLSFSSHRTQDWLLISCTWRAKTTHRACPKIDWMGWFGRMTVVKFGSWLKRALERVMRMSFNWQNFHSITSKLKWASYKIRLPLNWRIHSYYILRYQYHFTDESCEFSKIPNLGSILEGTIS